MWLYKPPSFNEKDVFFHLNNAHNFFYITYENITLIDDFNMIPENKKLSDFCEMNKFERLILTLFRIEGGQKSPLLVFPL